MKIPNLRAKIKPKRCKGNIHFGKIVLTFMLVGMMVLGNVEPVKASDEIKTITFATILEEQTKSDKLSQVITIYHLKNVEDVSVDIERVIIDSKGKGIVEPYFTNLEKAPANIGEVSYMVNGDKVTIDIIDNYSGIEIMNKSDEYIQYRITIKYTDNLGLPMMLENKGKENISLFGGSNQIQSSYWRTVASFEVDREIDMYGGTPSLELEVSRYRVLARLYNESNAGGPGRRVRSYEITDSSILQDNTEFRARFVGRAGGQDINLTTNSAIYYSFMQAPVSTITYGSRVSSDYRLRYRGEIIFEARGLNSPPTTPSSITVPTTIKSGDNFTVSWGSSTDPDGDSITYRLERQVNGGNWTQIYSGSSRSKTESPQSSWNTVAYRVRAYDGRQYSGYSTSPTRTVTHNNSPTLTISSPSENSYFV